MIAALLLASTLVPPQVIAIEDLRKQISEHYQRPVSLEAHISHRAFLSTVDKWDDQRIKRLLDTYGLILQEDREDGPLTVKRRPTQALADRRAREDLLRQLLDQLKVQSQEALKRLSTFRDTPIDELYARIPQIAAQLEQLQGDSSESAVRKRASLVEERRNLTWVTFLKERPLAEAVLTSGVAERLTAPEALWQHPVSFSRVPLVVGEFLPRLRFEISNRRISLTLEGFHLRAQEEPVWEPVIVFADLETPPDTKLFEALRKGSWDWESSFVAKPIRNEEKATEEQPELSFKLSQPVRSMIDLLAQISKENRVEVFGEVIPPFDVIPTIPAGEQTLSGLSLSLPDWRFEWHGDVLWVSHRCSWLLDGAAYATAELVSLTRELVPSVYGQTLSLASCENFVSAVFQSKASLWSRSPFSRLVDLSRFEREPDFAVMWLWNQMRGASKIPASISLKVAPARTLEQFIEFRDVYSDAWPLYGDDFVEELRQSRVTANLTGRSIAKGHEEIEISLQRPTPGWRWATINALQRREGGGWSRMLESRVQPAVEW